MGAKEGPHSSNDGLYRATAGSILGYCQHSRGQEQQQEPRAGWGTPLCKVAGPGPITKVTYLDTQSLSSLMFTPPMYGSSLTPTSRPTQGKGTWASTSTAPSLPPMVPAPIGGGIHRGCTKVSHTTMWQPVSAEGNSPQTGLPRLEAVGL